MTTKPNAPMKPKVPLTPKPSPFKNSESGKEDEALAALQNEMQDFKNDRNEERFLLVVCIIVLLDAFIFTQMANWAGALVIGVIEIFAIAVLARRWRIEEVPQMLSKFLDRTAERINPPPAASNQPTVGSDPNSGEQGRP